jgi:small GTP-binding protein
LDVDTKSFKKKKKLDHPPFKIVFLGDSGTGKSSIIARSADRQFSGTPAPTVGCAGQTVEYDYGGRHLHLLIWDTAGQELDRSLTPIYYRNATAAVIVFDVTLRDTFDQIQNWITEVRSVVDNIVLVICGNKADLEDERVVDGIDAADIARGANAAYVETSAKLGTGLEALFQTVVRESIDRKPDLLEKVGPDLRANGREGCC